MLRLEVVPLVGELGFTGESTLVCDGCAIEGPSCGFRGMVIVEPLPPEGWRQHIPFEDGALGKLIRTVCPECGLRTLGPAIADGPVVPLPTDFPVPALSEEP